MRIEDAGDGAANFVDCEEHTNDHDDGNGDHDLGENGSDSDDDVNFDG